MSLNPLKWIEWLITEHGSSTVLRERLGQAKDQIEILKSERDDLKVRLEKAQVEIGSLKKENDDLRKKIGGVGAMVG
jgi:chromosome segregation ATPase